jgi:hypothetical protein
MVSQKNQFNIPVPLCKQLNLPGGAGPVATFARLSFIHMAEFLVCWCDIHV